MIMPYIYCDLKPNPELGQVWTPNDIAIQMVKSSMQFVGEKRNVKVLDPACGPGTFVEAFCSAGYSAKELDFTCYDIDNRMMLENSHISGGSGFLCSSVNQNYLLCKKDRNNYDLVIMNPPYIRHEKISVELKNQYYEYLEMELGAKINGRSNLFVLFMLKGIVDLKPEGIMCAIVYDAVCNSKYGKDALSIIDRHAHLLHSENVSAPFEGILIDAKILIYKKRSTPLSPHTDNEGRGVDLPSNHVFLKDLLDTRRGTTLPNRSVFIASQADMFFTSSKPFFIKQANLEGVIVEPDSRVYLSSNKMDMFYWLEKRAIQKGVNIANYAIRPVCGNILFNYYIRNNPRHLLNPNLIPASDNFYVSTPTNLFPEKAAWLLLNSDIFILKIFAAGRNQGNGLTKLQLFEYRNVVVPDWTLLSSNDVNKLVSEADELLSSANGYQPVKSRATELARSMFR